MKTIFSIYRLLRALEDKEGLSKLGSRARAVLGLIGEQEEAGVAPTVGDVVVSGQVGSAPTVYGALDELQAAGWIERLPDSHDGRARRVQLTAKARQTFTRMARKFNSALTAE